MNNENAANVKKHWCGKWIGRPDAVQVGFKCKILPAPYLRKTFICDSLPEQAKVYICGLGYYELYINGRKVGDHVLDPVVSQYDQRVHYAGHDVTEYLRPGSNIIGVILGNGWYNSHTVASWHFDKATWRDYPKLLLDLEFDGEPMLCSDTDWKVCDGPIVFDSLRSGETYDARRELTGWLEADYDDSAWRRVVQVTPPGGLLEPQLMPPCKVMQQLPATASWIIGDNEQVYDFGQNIAGWCRLTVKGEAGTELIIKYGEKLTVERKVDRENILGLISDENFQTDRYILKGGSCETWEPRFTYHGFQYVSITVNGQAEISRVEGRVVHTAFEQVGNFSSSNELLNRLQRCTVWSYIGNFVGIPTDCPHREKNGWTGDAHLAAETGLMNFDAASAYETWLDSVVDCQRPSGQLPGIVPSTGWGYNWGSGPAWDSVLLLMPWYIYLYTGDDSAIQKHYPAMKKYVDYCTSMATGNIVSFGLGDWCHIDKNRITETALTSTGYYYCDTVLLAMFAAMTGHDTDVEDYSRLAQEIKTAFNARFYHGNGIYGGGEMTAMACAVYQGLAEDSEQLVIIERLVEEVNKHECKIDFGILGAKYIPRVLADNGYVELAYRIITQPEYPGWVHWLKQGATTLWEFWNGKSSRNHIMFGDISAWMYQYLAGITPDPENPGFKHLFIKPQVVTGLDWVNAEHTTRYGTVTSSWRRDGDKIAFEIELPTDTSATVTLPDGRSFQIGSGKHKI